MQTRVDDEAAREWRRQRSDAEKRSRHKRQAKLLAMKNQVEALESVAANLSKVVTVSPDAALLRLVSTWDDDDDDDDDDKNNNSYYYSNNSDREDAHTDTSSDVDEPDEGALRMRAFLSRALEMGQQMRVLQQEGGHLRGLLREHQATAKLLASWTAGAAARSPESAAQAAWAENVDWWNRLSKRHFTNWTEAACVAYMRASRERIHGLAASTEFVTSQGEFMGWRDSRRVTHETSTLQFSFSKAFAHCDMEKLFEMYWEMHFSAEVLCRRMLGTSQKMHVELLQKVSDNIMIFRRDVRYPNISLAFHAVYLMFRLRTPTGFMHCIRSIPCPDLQEALTGANASGAGGWMDNFHWTNMDEVVDRATGKPMGCRVSFSGLISSQDPAFANRWMMEIALTLVRAESSFVGPVFLTA